jgi:hypothetical protein
MRSFTVHTTAHTRPHAGVMTEYALSMDGFIKAPRLRIVYPRGHGAAQPPSPCRQPPPPAAGLPRAAASLAAGTSLWHQASHTRRWRPLAQRPLAALLQSSPPARALCPPTARWRAAAQASRQSTRLHALQRSQWRRYCCPQPRQHNRSDRYVRWPAPSAAGVGAPKAALPQSIRRVRMVEGR